jgi:hypothetical protein
MWDETVVREKGYKLAGRAEQGERSAGSNFSI